jgi:hypothetical protein
VSATASALLEPSFSVFAFVGAESELRRKYLGLGARAVVAEAEPPLSLLEKSAVVLETLVLVAAIHEALAVRGRRWSELSPAVVEEIDPIVQERSGLDPETVFADFVRLFGKPQSQPARVDIAEDMLVRALRGAVEQCPIDYLEEIARPIGRERFGHRCRIAYDAIRAFVRRHDPAQQEQLRVAGEAFKAGKLSLIEVAKLLEVHPVDAVALLEEHGYDRSLATLALTDEEREAVYSRMRADRLARRGEPAWTHESVARETVASERIEGVDARRWIHREG